MNKYLIIDKNTLSRESFSSLIYELEKNSVVYESESLRHAIDLTKYYQTIDYVIFNPMYEQANHSDYLGKLECVLPDAKKLLISQNTDNLNVEILLQNGVDAVITINSNRSEVITAIQSIKTGQSYIGQYVLKFKNKTSEPDESDELPTMKSKFTNEINKKLTARQREVLDYMTKGFANKLIAYELGVSEGTVKLHVSSILRALKVTNRTEAAMQAGQFLNSHAH